MIDPNVVGEQAAGGVLPVIEYGHIETPAPTSPGGRKGMGEGGEIVFLLRHLVAEPESMR